MTASVFDLFKRAAAPQPAAAPPVVSLWKKATHYLMFFTLDAEQFASHYVGAGKSSSLCTGGGCPAGGGGVGATEHASLPVWDVMNRRVAVLKFLTKEDGPAGKI